MANMSLCGPGDPRKRSGKIDSMSECENFDTKSRSRMSIGKFIPKKKNGKDDHHIDPIETGGLHMNMRDLGSTSGDVGAYKNKPSADFTPSQINKAIEAEKGATKEKAKIKAAKDKAAANAVK